MLRNFQLKMEAPSPRSKKGEDVLNLLDEVANRPDMPTRSFAKRSISSARRKQIQ